MIFRIAAADAVSNFKKMQAQSLIQSFRRDINFDESAKEVVLLEYDSIYQWLNQIEIVFLAAKGKMTKSMNDIIHDSYNHALIAINVVLDSYPDIFSKSVSEYVKMIHAYCTPAILKQIASCVDLTIDKAYGHIVQTFIDYLQHILLALHEINNNLRTENPPFISVSKFVQRNYPENRFGPLLKRAEYFKSIGCGETFVLKSYVPFEVYDDAVEHFKKYSTGITLLKEDRVSGYPMSINTN
jgi:hypothetical protein